MSITMDRPTHVRERERVPEAPPAAPPAPRGWGSHQERRTMQLGLAFFFLLGLYAAAFALLGALVWS